jgi:hypothetical protein
VVFGNARGERPADAPDTDDDAAMLAWLENRLTIGVRVDQRPISAGMMIDCDVARQLGLSPAGTDTMQ